MARRDRGVGEQVAETAGAAPPNPGELRAETRALEQLSAQSGLPAPPLWIERSPVPQAYTFGETPYDSVVGISSGLLEIMEPTEVRAVLAHEVGHIANGDVLTHTSIALKAAQREGLLRGVHIATAVVSVLTKTLVDDYARLLLYPARLAYRRRQVNKLQEFCYAVELAADQHAADADLAIWLRSGLRKLAIHTGTSEMSFPHWKIISQFSYASIETHPPFADRIQALDGKARAWAGEEPCPKCLSPIRERCDRCGATPLGVTCRQCRSSVRADLPWCTNCGQQHARGCAQCGAADGGGAYCTQCGGTLP